MKTEWQKRTVCNKKGLYLVVSDTAQFNKLKNQMLEDLRGKGFSPVLVKSQVELYKPMYSNMPADMLEGFVEPAVIG